MRLNSEPTAIGIDDTRQSVFKLRCRVLKPMAEIISDKSLDAALKEIAGFSEAEVRMEINGISSVQPALVTYFIAMTEDYSEGIQSFASAMFIAIHKIFEKQFGPLQKVGTKRVEQIADRNEQVMIYVRIRQPEEAALLPAAMAGSASQPSLLAYVSESIGTAQEKLPDLSAFRQDCLVVILKTVIDVLDSAVHPRR